MSRAVIKRRYRIVVLSFLGLVLAPSLIWLFRIPVFEATLLPSLLRTARQQTGLGLRVGKVSGTLIANVRLEAVRALDVQQGKVLESLELDSLEMRYSLPGLLLRRADFLKSIEIIGLRTTIDAGAAAPGDSGRRKPATKVAFPPTRLRNASIRVRLPSGHFDLQITACDVREAVRGVLSGFLEAEGATFGFRGSTYTFRPVTTQFQVILPGARGPEPRPDTRHPHVVVNLADLHRPSLESTLALWGGHLQAEVGYDRGSGKIRVKAAADGLGISRLLMASSPRTFPLSGKLNLRIDGSFHPGLLSDSTCIGVIGLSEAAWKAERMGDFEAAFRLDQGRLAIDGIRSASGPVDVSGRLVVDLPSRISQAALAALRVEGQVEMRVADMAGLPILAVPDGLRGSAGLHVDFRGSLGHPYGTYSARAEHAMFRSLQIDRAQVDGSFAGRSLSVSAFSLLSDEDLITGTASFELAPKLACRISATGRAASLSKYAELIHPSARKLPGRVQVAIDVDSHAPPADSTGPGACLARVRASYERAPGHAFPSVDLDLTATGQEILLTRVSAEAPGYAIRLSASAKHDRGKLHSIEVTSLTGHVADVPLKLAGPAIAEVAQEGLSVRDLEVSLADGSVTAHGELSSNGQVDARLAFSAVPTRPFLETFIGPVSGDLRLTGYASAAGPITNPTISMSVKASDRSSKAPLAAELEARLDRRGVVVDAFTVRRDGHPLLEAMASIPTGLRGTAGEAAFSVAVKAEGFSWDVLNPYVPDSWRGSGDLTGQISLTTSEGRLVGHADVAASRFSLPRWLLERFAVLNALLPLDARFALSVDASDAVLETSTLTTSLGEFTCKANLPLAQTLSWPPSVSWVDRERPFQLDLRARDLRTPPGLFSRLAKSQADVSLVASGRPDDYRAVLVAKASGLDLPWPSDPTVYLDIELSTDSIVLRRASLGPTEAPNVTITGSLGAKLTPSARHLAEVLPPDGRLNLFCEFRENMPPKLIQLPVVLEAMSGEMTGQVHVTGTFSDPKALAHVQAHGEARSPGSDGTQVPSEWTAEARVLYEGNLITVGDLTFEWQQGRLESTARIPVLYGAWPGLPRLDLHSAWNAELSISEFQLAALQRLLPSARAIGGLVSGHVRFRGRPTQPSVTGSLAIRDGDFRLPAVFPPIERVNADLEIDYPLVRLLPSTFLLGAEIANMEGKCELSGLRVERADLAVTGKRLLLYRSPDVQCRADVKTSVTWDQEDVLVSGRLRVSDLNIRRAGAFQAAPGAKRPNGLAWYVDAPWARRMRLDLELTADETIDVQTDFFSGAMSALLHVGGTALVPLLRGTLDTKGCRIRFPYVTFAVETGLVEFQETSSSSPYVTVSARGERSGFRITLSVSGPYDNPALLLSSVPYAPSEDLWTLVLTGYTPAALQDIGAARTVAIQVGKFLGQSLWRRIFRTTAQEQEIDWAERISVEVGPDQTQSGNQTMDALIALSDNVEVRAERDKFDQYNLDLVYVLRFR